MTETKTKTSEQKTLMRPPVVVVMGHIDHGKTKILDWYRKTKVVEQESGGITQHIGAYEVEHKGQKITFIDTPGHEAFSKMRSRGAQVADLAILVVAADEGVKPQTKEAIQIIQSNNLPFVVALNKIDKLEANPEKIKQQLAEENVLVESYGGKIPSVQISAKNGDHMEELLEVLLLLAELENLQADSALPGEGVVIEAHLDTKRGITSTLLIRNGSVRLGDHAAIGRSEEIIKILEDFLGRQIEEAGPSSPIRVTGLSETPVVGDFFKIFPSKKEAQDYIKSLPPEIFEKKGSSVGTEERPIFNIILKTDVGGSKEVLEESLKKMDSEMIGINLLRTEVGNISESDIKLALATKLVTIVGFKVKVDSSARELAERGNIRILEGEIIYEILDQLKKEIEERIPSIVSRKDLGKIKILKLFKKEGSQQIIGGRVEEGMARRGARIEIKRNKESIGTGNILKLQKDKTEVSEILKGNECGIMVDSKSAIQEGDVLEIFEEEIVKRTL